MVSVLDFGATGPGSSPGREHCVVSFWARHLRGRLHGGGCLGGIGAPYVEGFEFLSLLVYAVRSTCEIGCP